jgi:putative hydrolase of the HAD superfamily
MAIRALLFDLDNTLYPSSAPMGGEISRRITAYVQNFMGVDWEEASRLRRHGFARYGTTLKWLETEEGFSDIDDYLKSVHPPDVRRFLPRDPQLREMIEGLPHEKFILTNSSADHAERVLEHFGIRDLFSGLYDITFNGMQGKPARTAYEKPLSIIPWDAGDILFIDDVPKYLEGFVAVGGQGLLIDEDQRHADYHLPKIRSIHELPDFLVSRLLSQ